MNAPILDRILIRSGIRFPVGSYVCHPVHGTGQVLARAGDMASVEFVETEMTPVDHLKPEDFPPDVDPELLLAAGTETRWTVDLSISALAVSSAPRHWAEIYSQRGCRPPLDANDRF